jgi:D-sedoheptulose 7-phosphate isomerase
LELKIVNIRDYFSNFFEILNNISVTQLDCGTSLLDEAYRQDRTIFVVGNGQSAATASAFALDLSKQSISSDSQRRFRIISLSDNLAAITAWANDLSYEAIFTEQLKTLFRAGDILLAISVSGNSPNILRASEWVIAHKGKVIALTGFEGGQLQQLADTAIIINSSDYGYVETAHVAIMHYWVDFFRERLRR